MKKISISKIIIRKRRAKFILLILCFFLVGLSTFYFLNPKTFKSVFAWIIWYPPEIPAQPGATDPVDCSNGLKIYKVLEPIQRNGSVNTSFNPYAVQKDDVIKVNLEIRCALPLTELNITDKLLTNAPANNIKCVPQAERTVSTLLDSDKIGWALTTDSDGKGFVYYNCKFQ